MKKTIAFIAPVGEGGPKSLYMDLVELLAKKYPDNTYVLISSIKDWLLLHFFNKNYNLIISAIPFFWKPPSCEYIIHQQGLYKKDRGFSSIPKLLNWLYPYNSLFSIKVIYPSKFIKKHYNSSHRDQKIIYNVSSYTSGPKEYTIPLKEKKELIFLTVTGFSFYEKALGMEDIFQKLISLSFTQDIKYYICGNGKYLGEIKNKLQNYPIPKNIKIYFLGKIQSHELKKLLLETDIFLYSSFQDTFGLSIIEAMGYHVPVILNNYELFSEIYDNDFIMKDIEHFHATIRKLIGDQEFYNTYIQKGNKNLEKFNPDFISTNWQKIIDEVLIEKP